MRRAPAGSFPPRRTVGVLSFLLLASVAGGCGLPAKVRALVARPTPTPLPVATPLPAPPLKLEFVRIREERARGDAAAPLCEIDVKLSGTKRSEVEAARVVVAKAVDDVGTVLVREGSPALEPVTGEDPDAEVVLPVPLKLAPRRAVSLAEVSGEIGLYVPEADPGAVVGVARFRAEAGKLLAAPSLAANGVAITFASAQEAAALPAEPDDLVLKVADPKRLVEGFYFVDPEGTAWRTNREERGGWVVLSSQAENPGPDWGLRVRLMTPGTFRRYRFALKDVPLP